jgi:LPXTG-motif cell wall-anchored protein
MAKAIRRTGVVVLLAVFLLSAMMAGLTVGAFAEGTVANAVFPDTYTPTGGETVVTRDAVKISDSDVKAYKFVALSDAILTKLSIQNAAFYDEDGKKVGPYGWIDVGYQTPQFEYEYRTVAGKTYYVLVQVDEEDFTDIISSEWNSGKNDWDDLYGYIFHITPVFYEVDLEITNARIVRISEAEVAIEFDSNGHGDMYIDHLAGGKTIEGVYMNVFVPGHNSITASATADSTVATEITLSAYQASEDHSIHSSGCVWEQTFPIPAWNPSAIGSVSIKVGTVTDLNPDDSVSPDPAAEFAITITATHPEYGEWPLAYSDTYELVGGGTVTNDNGTIKLKAGQQLKPIDFLLDLYGGLKFSVSAPTGYVLDTATSAQEITLTEGKTANAVFNFTFGQTPPPAADGDKTTLTDTATGTSVKGELDSGTSLAVTPISDGTNFLLADSALKDAADKFVLFDINLMKDDAKVQPNGKVLVSIPVPQGYDGAKCKVYRIEADGSKTDMNAALKSGKLEFETDHFSLYAIAQTKADAGTSANTDNSSNTDNGGKNPQTGDNSMLTVYLGIMLLSMAAVVLSIIRGRKKASNN